jgi:hypothetical protein
MADVGVFGRYKGFADFQEAAKANSLKDAIAMSQIQAAKDTAQYREKMLEIQAAKANKLNVKQLGEVGFVKAAQGIVPSPEENAAMRYLDAKTGGMQFDPVTGNAMQKPSLLDKIPFPTSQQPPPSALPGRDSEFNQVMNGLKTVPGTGDFITDIVESPAPSASPAPVATPSAKNDFDIAFEKELAKASGNPKLQQQLRADYAKKKYEMTDAETKNAGFADRMAESNPIIEARTSAGTDPLNRIKAAIPLIGNVVVGSDYRSFNQAQRDFINAQLRRESGAVIADSEFENAAQQYFPQVGDDKNVIAQKKANRDAVFNAMVRSAGPAYIAPVIKVPDKTKNSPKQEFELNKIVKGLPKGAKFLGYE